MTLPALAFLGVDEGEMLLIMVAVLILFGGKRMPDFARGLGKAIKELRKATGEVEREFKRVMDEAENAVPQPTIFPKAGSPAPVPRTETLPASPAPHLPASQTASPALLPPSAEPHPKDKPAHLPDIELPPAPHAQGEHDYHSDI